MTTTAERKRHLIRRIERHRGRLAGDLETLRDDVGWVGGLLGGVGMLVSVKPKRWKTWMRLLTFAPMAFRLVRRIFRRSGRARRAKKAREELR